MNTEQETDSLIQSSNLLQTQSNDNNGSEEVHSEPEPKPPLRLYSFVFWMWALLFWVFMLVGGLHGLIVKGPIELVMKREEWTSSGYLEWWAWLILALIIIFFAYCEGYRGFQLAFSPMLVKRAYHFSSVTTPVYQWTKVIYIDRFTDFLLAPLLSAGFICGTRRRLCVTWGVTVCVLSLIIGVSYMSEELPWKCFIDIGVVIGLGWGSIFIMIWWFKICFLDKWPDWVPDEYPQNVIVRRLDNVLVKNNTRPFIT